jgi:ring-1,2-phenylacetyl-CoA epoxidase subunit PaaE
MIRFHSLPICRVERETAQAVCVTFAVPPELLELFTFKPGQFLTLQSMIGGESTRRSYSICSSTQHYAATGELSVGIKQVSGGVFSSFAQTLAAGATLDVMPPEGRFSPKPAPNTATQRWAFAAGSGITPILSIIASSLAADATSRFTLVYSNRNLASVMFGEALQDLKDRYPARLVLHHLFSRQHVECALYNGRLDASKASELLQTNGDQAIDEAFVCGPEAMIVACEAALLASGLAPERLHTERFASGTAPVALKTIKTIAEKSNPPLTSAYITLELIADGKTHILPMQATDTVLDVALAAGLDLPYSCRGGVCCTCRARVLGGSVSMAKNYTLEASEMQQGYVLSCQARPAANCERVVVSFDER